jgi:hypothetical protein
MARSRSPSFCDDCADPRGGREQRRGLGADDLQIGFLAGCRVVGGHELQHFALGDHGGRLGQDLEHLQRPVGDHQLEGAGEQEVADQHRGLVAPQRIGAVAAAAQHRLVDHVVMQQGRGMDEFDAGGQRDVTVALEAAELGRGEGEHRPQALAAGRDEVSGELRDERDRALHVVDDDLVDPPQVVEDQVVYRLQTRLLLAPSAVQADDGAHV